MSFLKQRLTVELAILMWGDVFLGIGAFYLAMAIPVNKLFAESLKTAALGFPTLVFVFSLLLCSSFVELYKNERKLSMGQLFLRVLTNVALSFLLLSVIFILLPPIVPGKAILVISLISFGTFQWVWHALYLSLYSSPHISKRLLILGANEKARLLGSLVGSGNYPYELVGYVQNPSEPSTVPSRFQLTNPGGLPQIIEEQKPHTVVVSFGERRGTLPLKDILSAKLAGIKVYDAPSFYELLTGKLLIEHITPGWLIFSDGFQTTPLTALCKTWSDKAIACIALLILSPILILISLLVRLESSGPSIFKQVRIGQHGKPFTIYKFRTMVQDAEKDSGPQWAKQNDPRVTAVGNILRKTRLDELPQLYNVLKGELSIVGPRPERPMFVKELEKIIPFYAERHFVKPGITGWAQINYPYGDSVEDAIEKLRYDLYYMKHMSFWLDIFIILSTFNVVLFRRGSR